MLDLNFVRDNLSLVEEKLRLRGMDPAQVLKDFHQVDARAPSGNYRGRNHEGPAQPRLRGHCQAQEERPGRERPDRRNQRIAGADSATERRRRRNSRPSCRIFSAASPICPMKACRPANLLKTMWKCGAGARHPNSISLPSHTGNSENSSACWTSNAPPNFPARASPFIGTWEHGWSGRSPTSCSTCTLASTDTPRCCRLIW